MQTNPTIDAHQKSNIVQMAEGVRSGIPPTNAQINAELEATKQHLSKDTATTAKEEKALHDARKLVEAAQTTLVVKNSDEKMQQLAAAVTTMSTSDTGSSTQFGGNRAARKRYNKFMTKLREITLAFGNSPSFRKSFVDLTRILREIFNVAANNSGLSGQGLKDNLRQQLDGIRQSRAQQPGWGQVGHAGHAGQLGQVGHAGQLGQVGVLPTHAGQVGVLPTQQYNPNLAPQGGLLSGVALSTGILPGQPGYVDPTHHHAPIPGQPGYGAPAGTSLLPGQHGYVDPTHHHAHGTGLLPGQPGYVDPTHQHAHGILPGQPGYVDPTHHHAPIPGQPGYGAPAGTSLLLPGQPGYVDPTHHHAHGTGLLPGQPGYVDPTHQHAHGTGLLPGQTGASILPGQPGTGLMGQTNINDIIPEEHRARFRQQLKEFLHEVNAHADTKKYMEEVFSVWNSLNGNMYQYMDQIKTNTSGTNIPQTAKAVVEEFTGERTIDDFLEYLRYAILTIDGDHHLKEYLREARDYLLMALDDPELVDSDDYYNQGIDMLQRGRHVTYRYQNDPTFVGLFEEARLLSEEIKNDVTLNLLKDRSQQFFSNFVYKDPRTNTPKIDFDLVESMRSTLVPFLIERIKEIPMPRVEVQNKDFEYLIIDDLHLLLGNILPDQVAIHSHSLAKLAAEAKTTLNQVDAHAPSSRLGTAHPEHVHGTVGDTHVHVMDDSRRAPRPHSHDGYNSSDDDTSYSSDDDDYERNRPTQVRVGGKDVTHATYAGTPGHSTTTAVDTHHAHHVPAGSNVVHTTGTVAPAVVHPIVHPATVHPNAVHGYTTVPAVVTTHTGAVPVVAGTAHHTHGSYTGTHTAGSRIRFRIANIKPEFRNFYFSMKKISTPSLIDEGRMNMSLKGRGLTIVGAFSLVQNAAGVAQISDPRIRVSLSRVKFDILQAKHKMLLKMGFIFMGRTISRQVERAVQERLEKLIIEWSDVLNQKVIPHLPPVDQLNQKGVDAVSRVADKVVEKTA